MANYHVLRCLRVVRLLWLLETAGEEPAPILVWRRTDFCVRISLVVLHVRVGHVRRLKDLPERGCMGFLLDLYFVMCNHAL